MQYVHGTLLKLKSILIIKKNIEAFNNWWNSNNKLQQQPVIFADGGKGYKYTPVQTNFILYCHLMCVHVSNSII